MNEINIGNTVARCRKEAGITQEELAQHLGVTKAAVSKWELEQSLPDMAMLPKIASYFSLTLDELFDYQPQLTAEEIKEIAFELLQQFAVDSNAAYENLLEYARDYSSCYPLLHQLGVVLVNRLPLAGEIMGEYSKQASDILKRVEAKSENLELVSSARYMRASLCFMQGQTDTALDILEDMKPNWMEAEQVQILRAAIYEQQGNAEEAARIYQTSLFQAITSFMNGLTAQITAIEGDEERLAALVNLGEAWMDAYHSYAPSLLPELGFFGATSLAFKRGGDTDRAFSYLTRYVAGINGVSREDLLAMRPSILFNKLDELFFADAANAEAHKAATEEYLIQSLKDQILLAPEWNDCLTDEQFVHITAPLENL